MENAKNCCHAPKITPSGLLKLIQEVTQEPGPASEALQASYTPVKVRVRDSTIGKKLEETASMRRFQGQNKRHHLTAVELKLNLRPL